MFNFFKKGGDAESGGSGLDTIMKAAKMMGFDPWKMASEKLPEITELARQCEQRAGSPLFLTIALDDQKEFLTLCLFRLTPEGAECIKSYPINDLPTIVSQIQYDLNNIPDANYTVQGQIADSDTGTDTETDTTTGTADSEATGTDTATGTESESGLNGLTEANG